MPPSQLLNTLLTAMTVEQQIELLQAANFLTVDGLSALLDAAQERIERNPEAALALTHLCLSVVDQVQAPAVAARAAYLRAYALAVKGEFDEAYTLVNRARAGYETLGLEGEALRTVVGLMRILGETGRYAEALEAGATALARIAEHTAKAEQSSLDELAARIWHHIGLCHEMIGGYEKALQAYAQAETSYRTLALDDLLADILVNRGIVLKVSGQVSAALAAFEEALQTNAGRANPLFRAQTLINSGEAHLLLGNYLICIETFGEAERQLNALGELADQPILLRHLADAYLALNLHGEALDAYRRANLRLREAGLAHDYGLALWGMGVAFMARGQLSEAQRALAEAALLFRTQNILPLLSAVLLEQATLTARQGNPAAARALAQDALALVADSPWTVQKLYAYLRNADLALPDTAAAEPLLAAAQALASEVELPQLRYRLQQRWGHLRLLQGDDMAAQAHLAGAIDEIERLRNTLVQERMRASFLDDKLAAYQDLIRLHLNRGDAASVQQAFAIAERAKSRALVDLIAGVIQLQLGEPADEAATADLRRWQAELTAIYNELLGGSGGDNLRTVSATTLRTRAAELEQMISQHQLRTQARTSLAPLQPSTAPFPLISSEDLPTNLALLVYHIVGEEIMAFIYTGRELHPVRHLSTVPRVQGLLQRLGAQWVRLSTGQPFLARHLPQLQQATQRLLQLLYHELMAPVQATLAIVAPVPSGVLRKLVIVPHGLLHQLPFHALHDGQRYLVEDYAISYAPSATVFALCQERKLRSTGIALALGAPDARIPAAATEARRVAGRLQHHFADVRLLLGEGATLDALLGASKHCSVLHLACHGLFRVDNPIFSSLKLHDEWLTAANVAQLQLNQALVTLSACESGRAGIVGGDEIIGLVYAFLGAGAATLLVSQWLVQDETTATLMDQWYSRLADGDDLAVALRAVQLDLMTRHPHPYYWAPFVLVGQRFWGNG